jgi:hypothetical protein
VVKKAKAKAKDGDSINYSLNYGQNISGLGSKDYIYTGKN